MNKSLATNTFKISIECLKLEKAFSGCAKYDEQRCVHHRSFKQSSTIIQKTKVKFSLDKPKQGDRSRV
jgi:hypothetical protein